MNNKLKKLEDKFKIILRKVIVPIFIFILLLLGMVFFPQIPLKLFNINIDKFSESMKTIYMFCSDIGYMIILFMLYKDTLIDNFKKFIKNYRENMDLSLKYYFIGLLIMMASNFILAIFFKDASPNNENVVRLLLKEHPLYMIFSVSINAPFAEELIFRKSIKDFCIGYKDNRFTKYLYIITSGFIFASLHVIGMVNSPLDYLYIIPYLALGISFAALYYKTDNIFLSMNLHFIHNSLAVILLFVAGV